MVPRDRAGSPDLSVDRRPVILLLCEPAGKKNHVSRFEDKKNTPNNSDFLPKTSRG